RPEETLCLRAAAAARGALPAVRPPTARAGADGGRVRRWCRIRRHPAAPGTAPRVDTGPGARPGPGRRVGRPDDLAGFGRGRGGRAQLLTPAAAITALAAVSVTITVASRPFVAGAGAAA